MVFAIGAVLLVVTTGLLFAALSPGRRSHRFWVWFHAAFCTLSLTNLVESGSSSSFALALIYSVFLVREVGAAPDLREVAAC